MTFNFTRSAFKNQRNFALIIDNPEEVKEIRSHFQADWQRRPAPGQAGNLLWSPDNSRKKLLDLIANAKHDMQIYMQSLTDYQIINALKAAAKKGVNIEILTSDKKHQKQLSSLQKAGIHIHPSRHYYIHAKVFIVDKQLALLGSINLTQNSLDHNRELSVITKDPNVVKQLRDRFYKDLLCT